MKYKNIINDFLNELWNVKQADLDQIHGIMEDNIIISSPLGKKLGKSNLVDINHSWLKGFPNISVRDINIIQENNKIVASWICSGRHEDKFNNLNPTGNKVEYKGVTIFEFFDNTIVNYECYINMLNIYTQLGMYLAEEKYKDQNILRLNYDLLVSELQNFDHHPNKLTRREVECLSAFINGRTSKEIGQIFNISFRTVETNIGRAMDKLNVHSKSSLLDKIYEHKLLYIFRDLYDLILKSKNLI